jgi:diguanylate cyclase (GGDEF)-like protein
LSAPTMALCVSEIARLSPRLRVLETQLKVLRGQVDALRESASDLARRAYSDELTGLANRARMQERVDDLLRAEAAPSFALAFIDLDNFKHINDYYNHAVGDALLVRVARRIADLVRETDMLARTSGDEFLLLIHPIDGDDQVRSVVQDLLEKLKQPFHVEGFEIFTSACVGVSIHPEHGRSYEELRRNADSAMYRAKSGAKGAAAFYDVAVGQAMSARMELEQRLRLAIRDRRFCCAFQPKVDIRSQEVVGFETLVRWRDDDGDIHSPLSFIGLATELGVIDPITHFVLAEAIRSIDLLDDAFGAGKTIAVNVAARQAGDPRFMRSFVDALETSGHADRFIVEVTEDAFIATNQFQTHILPMLRNVGARVSIDDFGTGYSSLSVLADITADEIKIDRSFITDVHRRPRNQSVLKAMESVSSALGMSVVAEGVESFEELAYLLGATRIRFAQGYHFAKPFFLEEIVKTHGARGDERVIATERRRPERRPAAAARAAAGMRRD